MTASVAAAIADAVIVEAKRLAKASLAADRGTHMHHATEDDDSDRDWLHRAEHGETLSLPTHVQAAMLEAWRLMLVAYDLEVVEIEQAVVHDGYRQAGRLDRIAVLRRAVDDELNRISADLMRGIDDDLLSRKDWIENRAQGVKLLGLKIELPSLQGATDGAPVEGMSKVRHPLLLEAVLRFQANCRSELLPTDGPVKIRNDDNTATLEEDQIANALERDLNHYLTSTASEYYPDTDRMLLMLGFGGSVYRFVTLVWRFL